MTPLPSQVSAREKVPPIEENTLHWLNRTNDSQGGSRMATEAKTGAGAIKGAARAAIHMSGLTKYYGKKRGIEGLDPEVREGEVFFEMWLGAL